MKVSELLKTSEKFLKLLNDFTITSLDQIDCVDGPTWADRVKRAEIIKTLVAKTINKTQSEHVNNFLDYKESLLELFETEMSKLLKQTVTIDDDEFKFEHPTEILELEFNNAIIKIIDILKH